MATLSISDDRLHVTMGPFENLGALRKDFSVPVRSVVSIEYIDHARKAVRGLRVPGTHIPGYVTLGTFRGRGGSRTFAATHRDHAGYKVQLRGSGFDLIVVSMERSAEIDELAEAVAVRA